MKPNIKMIEELIEVLRSGKYMQCYGDLHNSRTGEYCVLGAAQDHFEMPDRYDITDIAKELGFDDNGITIEIKYVKQAVSDYDSSAFKIFYENKSDNYKTVIWLLNDRGFSFKQIADMLELKLEDYKKCLAKSRMPNTVA